MYYLGLLHQIVVKLLLTIEVKTEVTAKATEEVTGVGEGEVIAGLNLILPTQALDIKEVA